VRRIPRTTTYQGVLSPTRAVGLAINSHHRSGHYKQMMLCRYKHIMLCLCKYIVPCQYKHIMLYMK